MYEGLLGREIEVDGKKLTVISYLDDNNEYVRAVRRTLKQKADGKGEYLYELILKVEDLFKNE